MPDERDKPDNDSDTTKGHGQGGGDTIPTAVVPAVAAFIGGLLGAVVGSALV